MLPAAIHNYEVERSMSTITVPLPEASLAALTRLADQLGTSPQDLARQGIEELIHDRRTRFRDTADYVLEKNRELYRRLAQ